MTAKEFNETHGTGKMELLICQRTDDGAALVIIASKKLECRLYDDNSGELGLEAYYRPAGVPKAAGWYPVHSVGLTGYIVIER